MNLGGWLALPVQLRQKQLGVEAGIAGEDFLVALPLLLLGEEAVDKGLEAAVLGLASGRPGGVRSLRLHHRIQLLLNVLLELLLPQLLLDGQVLDLGQRLLQGKIVDLDPSRRLGQLALERLQLVERLPSHLLVHAFVDEFGDGLVVLRQGRLLEAARKLVYLVDSLGGLLYYLFVNLSYLPQDLVVLRGGGKILGLVESKPPALLLHRFAQAFTIHVAVEPEALS